MWPSGWGFGVPAPFGHFSCLGTAPQWLLLMMAGGSVYCDHEPLFTIVVVRQLLSLLSINHESALAITNKPPCLPLS